MHDPAPAEARSPGGAVEHHRVVVIGAGFAGIGAAVGLLDAGLEDFVVLERAGDVGGTWRDNTYPGCQCDVPSRLYSFSFADDADWQRSFPLQPELAAYLRRVARGRGVLPHVRFSTAVTELRWEEERQRWQLRTPRGALTADVVLMGNGPLSEPRVPDTPGLEAFRGTVFHSASWDHGHDLSGERVAVVGTGASAIQFVPHVRREAGHVTVFQRTAPWVLPHPGRRISAPERAVYRRVPAARKIARGLVYVAREAMVIGLAKQPRLLRGLERVSRAHLRRAVADPDLRAKLTPHYTAGCKRLLLSNDYYPALAAPDVHVVTAGIAEVRERSVVATDGSEHEVDTIVFGTGFHVTDNPVFEHVHGRGGRSLAAVWREHGMRAYKGTAVAGFPNLYLLAGPNTGIGHTSLVAMIEAQLRYVLGALRAMDRTGAVELEVREDALDAWNDDVQQRMEGTVWQTGGCVSWYQDAHGRNPTLWPDWSWRFIRATRRFDLAAYRARRPRTAPAGGVEAPVGVPSHVPPAALDDGSLLPAPTP